MLPRAYVEHQIKSRIRFSIPSKKGDRNYFDYTKDNLNQFKGVTRVVANPLTGSLLVIHNSKSALIKAFANEKQLFKTCPRVETNSTLIGSHLWKDIESIDDKLYRLSDGTLKLEQLTAFGLMGLGIFQIYQKHLFPPAMVLIDESIRIFSKLNRSS